MKVGEKGGDWGLKREREREWKLKIKENEMREKEESEGHLGTVFFFFFNCYTYLVERVGQLPNQKHNIHGSLEIQIKKLS